MYYPVDRIVYIKILSYNSCGVLTLIKNMAKWRHQEGLICQATAPRTDPRLLSYIPFCSLCLLEHVIRFDIQNVAYNTLASVSAVILITVVNPNGSPSEIQYTLISIRYFLH